MSEDNLSKQCDEIEALTSIYGDAVVTHCTYGQKTCDVKISDGVTLSVTMPYSYPNESPPIFEISAPLLRGNDKNRQIHFIAFKIQGEKEKMRLTP
jgi:hypothetical protein